eukprot:TRINITY_DN8757_c0_g1_i1.p1 TRINITY_DN8757_c0_g1~~TRINITY_DN8757_c0_g1_i1.p1  ORF type:complete len:235 (+),score=90.89 TRINITY_DN8757_c0_g1_i1:350-1054(+)
MMVLTDQKPEVYEVIAFQGVRLRSTPVYADKTDEMGPVFGEHLSGTVIPGQDPERIKYLQIFDTGLFVPMTDLSGKISVFSRVLEADDLDEMCSDVWAQLDMDMEPAGTNKTATSTPLGSPMNKVEDLEKLKTEHAQLVRETAQASSNLAEAKTKLSELREGNGVLEAKVEESKRRCQEAEEVSDKAGQVALDMQEELDEVEEEVEELEESVEALKAGNAELQAEIAAKKASVA